MKPSLIGSGLAHGDDADRIASFGVDDRDQVFPDMADSAQTQLVARRSRRQFQEFRPEDQVGVVEVEPVLLQVGQPLAVVSFEERADDLRCGERGARPENGGPSFVIASSGHSWRPPSAM
jgi:hypothetical protein